MFKIPRVNVIESDEGYSIEVLGRTGLRYTEGPRIMHIDSEVESGSPPSIALIKVSMKTWLPPYDNELVDDKKREAIIENIRRALQFDKAGLSVY